MVPTSSGDGKKSITPSSSSWTPLFLSALPANRDRARERASSKRRRQLLEGRLLAFEHLLEQIVGELGDLVDQLLAVDFELRRLVFGELDLGDRLTLVVVRKPVPLLGQDRGDASQILLGAQREGKNDRVGAKTLTDVGDHRLEVGAGAVELVDEGQARHPIAIRAHPHAVALRFDPCDAAENADRAVEHAQRPLDFSGEVDVPGRVDNVDLVLVPGGGGGRRGDRDSALTLFGHPVHGRGPFVDLAHAMFFAGVEEDAFGRRRLARIDVGNDSDVAHPVERSRHDNHLHFKGPSCDPRRYRKSQHPSETTDPRKTSPNAP
jgi:hypothetical protein